MISSVSRCNRGCSAPARRSARRRARRRSSHHHVGHPLHSLAVERRQQQPPLLEVIGFVEQDHRVAPDDRLQHAAPAPGCSTSAGAVNSSLISAGSLSITNGGWNGSRTVQRLPYRRSPSSVAVGRVHVPASCINAGPAVPVAAGARVGLIPAAQPDRTRAGAVRSRTLHCTEGGRGTARQSADARDSSSSSVRLRSSPPV